MSHPRDWLFVGHGPLSAAALERLVAVAPPRLVVTGFARRRPNAVEDVVRAHRLQQHRCRTASDDPRVLQAAAGALVGICCGWSERLGGPLLEAPAEGWLNLHPSRLPAWRGGDPVSWQLVTRARECGGSVHRMSAAYDDGPVVAEGSVPLHPDDDGERAMRRVGAELGRLAGEALELLRAGERLPERPQDDHDATWCPPLGVAPLLLPWRLSARQATRVMRAFSPWPGVALAGLAPDERAARPEPGPALAPRERPGTVVRDPGGRVTIAFTDAWLTAALHHNPPPG